MTRVALYTRVSTEDQAREGFSLDAQLERLRYYAKAQGWAVAGEYVDEGHSGRTTKRPQYTRMMAEISSWDTLLVLKMDRIHRNSRNFMAMMDQLRRSKREFASVTESLDTSTAMGRFVMDIIQRIAQLESDQIGERTHTGMEEKARQQGGSLGKPAPFGYRYLEGMLAPVSTEAPVVAELFRRFSAGATKQELATWLNEQGLRGRRKGALWTYKSVDHVLRNPTYAGALGWEDQLQRQMHPAIVEEGLFDQVQTRIRETSRKGRTYTLRSTSQTA
ncbi:MAG TPA: recombinase family protein [Candidatus Thermoplasmatota archaeon]|nr:recombinase family protein [Candidatus Thermoplasmatota archaeon]